MQVGTRGQRQILHVESSELPKEKKNVEEMIPGAVIIDTGVNLLV